MEAIHKKQAWKILIQTLGSHNCIQFYPYKGKNDFFDPDLGLGGSAVDNSSNQN